MRILNTQSLMLGLMVGICTVVMSSAINCSFDDDQTNRELDSCLQKGESFASQYEKALKKSKQFDKCQEFQPFGNCLRPMLHQCKHLNTTLHHKWKTILHTMDVACRKPDPPISLSCMETEYHSIYSKMCRDLYSFNILQNTHGKCRFLREKLDCEQSLIASNCGELVGHLYLSLMKATIKKEKCLVPHGYHTQKTNHFRYSPKCPANITAGITKCTTMYPKDTILKFMKENDLIVDGRRKQIKKSCSNYANYSSCIQGISESCPEGIDKVLQFNSKQRSYQLKMDYICFEKKREYLDSIYCYQEVMKNQSFNKCNGVWEQLNLKLKNITSYMYYCDKQHPASIALNRELVQLQECYEDVVVKSCGQLGASTMGGLINKAFQDPWYLRLKYMPDCSLHSPMVVPTTKPTTISTTISTHSKSSHKPNTVNIRVDNHSNNNKNTINIKVTPKNTRSGAVKGRAASLGTDLTRTMIAVVLSWWTMVYCRASLYETM